jgi:N-acetylglucosamine kinase
LQICADVGGSFVDIAIVSDEAEVLHRARSPTPIDDWDAFVALFREAQGRHGPLLPAAAAVSISLAGLIDGATGAIISANIRCLHGRALARDLEAALGRPVLINNDADCFVLAETRLGVARGHTRVFGIVLGTGVGGGLVHDGRLVTSPEGVGGEWGHGPVVTKARNDPAETPYFQCGCGQWGCLDTVGAARGIERLHRYLHGLDLDSSSITGAWERDDPQAAETMALYLDIVSGALAALLNTYRASIVPVGGGLAGSRRLVRELDAHVRQRMLRPPAAPLIVGTALGGRAGLLGAMLAVRG